jgi:Do/DeqQ family serine protease
MKIDAVLEKWWRPSLLLILGIVLGAGLFALILRAELTEIRQIKRTITSHKVSNGANKEENSRYFEPTIAFEEAAEKSLDAVVYINTKLEKQEESQLPDFFSVPREGSGSGVIIQADGYIVTNYHVIEHASAIQVSLNNKATYPAEVVAKDPNTDLAIVKIDETQLPTLPFANSDQVHIGQWVLAVGNPFNLNSTVTAGIVSAKARNIGILRNSRNTRRGIDYSIESFLQTDAAVNPGNSGGALVNLSGELIGINTAIATETGSFSGYSFAIPSNLVRKVVRDLLQYGRVQRGFIGVSIQDIDPSMAQKKDLSTREGAYVVELSPDGAARKAGIEVGDIIVSVNNEPVSSASELQEQIANYRPGNTVKVSVIRSGTRRRFSVTLRNIRGGTGLVLSEEQLSPSFKQLGADFTMPSETELKARSLEQGVKVTQVRPGGALAKADVPKGLIITEVDGQAVPNVRVLVKLMADRFGAIRIDGYNSRGELVTYRLNLSEGK